MEAYATAHPAETQPPARPRHARHAARPVRPLRVAGLPGSALRLADGWLVADAAGFDALRRTRQTHLFAWIIERLRPTRAIGRWGPIGLKHAYARTGGTYLSAAVFTAGMALAGYAPVRAGDGTWRFRCRAVRRADLLREAALARALARERKRLTDPAAAREGSGR